MSLPTERILGKWHKVGDSPCAVKYPETLEFRDTDVYLSSVSEKVFSLWQSGDFELVDDRTIKIQIANDAMVKYVFEIVNDRLRFVDDEGCQFEYERIV